MAVNKPVNKKEQFENEAKSFFYIFGIISLIVFIIICIILLVRHFKVSPLDSATSPLTSKYLLTATPNYF